MKRLFCIIMVLIIALAQGFQCVAIDTNEKNQVLFIYEYKSSESYQQISEYITRQAIYAGFECDTISQKSYYSGLMSKYSHVVFLNYDNSDLNGILLSDLKVYNNSLCWFGIGANQYKTNSVTAASTVSGIDKVNFLFGESSKSINLDTPGKVEVCYPSAGSVLYGHCFQDGSDKGVWAYSSGKFYDFGLTDGLNDNYKIQTCAEYLLASFFGRTTGIGGIYINIDYIYPISEYNTICGMADYLYKNNIHFTFTVMPFYQYAETSEGKEYGRMLQYLYQCGGTPVIHVPVFLPSSSNDAPEYSEMLNKLETSLLEYGKINVYPTAVELPENYLIRSNFTKLFSNFSDCFTVTGDGKDVYTVGDATKDAYLSKAKMTFQGALNVSSEIRIPTSSTEYGSFYSKLEFISDDVYGTYRVSFQSDMNLSTFKTLITGIKSHQVQIDNFNTGTHTVSVGKQKIQSKNGVVIYNGKVMQQGQIVKISSSSAVNNSGGLQKTMQGGNSFVIIFSSISIVVLAIACLVGKSIDRNKHIRRR